MHSSTFSSPASAFEDAEDEHYSFMLGTVISFKDVRVVFGQFVLDFIIADVETALGIIPVAMSRDIFDLQELKEGCVISMKADIKADLSNDDDFRNTKA